MAAIGGWRVLCPIWGVLARSTIAEMLPAARNRAGTGAESENDLEGVSDSALGIAGGRRFLPCGSGASEPSPLDLVSDNGRHLIGVDRLDSGQLFERGE
jgi:hypothetical protein